MIRLRPYRLEDADTILSWCANETAFYQWTAGVLGDYPLSREQFHSVSSLMAFTAVDDREVVGFFTMRNPGESVEEVRFGFVTVDSRRRGQGLGKAMLLLGLKYAREIYGAKKASLGVFENNPPAFHCYLAAGFQETDTVKYCIRGEEWNCREMEIVF